MTLNLIINYNNGMKFGVLILISFSMWSQANVLHIRAEINTKLQDTGASHMDNNTGNNNAGDHNEGVAEIIVNNADPDNSREIQMDNQAGFKLNEGQVEVKSQLSESNKKLKQELKNYNINKNYYWAPSAPIKLQPTVAVHDNFMRSVKTLKKPSTSISSAIQRQVTDAVAENLMAATDTDDEGRKATVETNKDAQLTASIWKELIYKYAIKHKQIHRVTIFTCQKASLSTENSKKSRNTNGRRKNGEYKIDKQQRTTKQMSSSVLTFEILKRINANSNNKWTATAASNASSTLHSTKSYNSPQQRRFTDSGHVFVKVIQIDQLINMQSNNMGESNLHEREGDDLQQDNNQDSSDENTEPSDRNAKWLDQAFGAEALRQIVVLDLSCDRAGRILLKMASARAFFNSTYHWLLIEDNMRNQHHSKVAVDDSDAESLNSINIDNIGKNIKKESKKEMKSPVVVGDSTSVETELLQDNSEVKIKPVPARGKQRPRQGTDLNSIEKFLGSLNININTELTLAKRSDFNTVRPMDDINVSAIPRTKVEINNNFKSRQEENKTNFTLYDVWSPGLQYGGQVNISEIGNFTLADGFKISSSYQRSTTITRRKDMQMAQIHCLIVLTHKSETDDLEHYLTTPYDAHLDSMNRFNFALLSLVREMYNFSFVLSQTLSWGYLKNGTFDGMIGALVRNEADIGGSPIFFRIERAKVIDYTARTWVARPCFIFRHPRNINGGRIVFLQPFSNRVWIFLGCCGIATILILWLLKYIERKLLSKARDKRVLSKSHTRHFRKLLATGKNKSLKKKQKEKGNNGIATEKAAATAAAVNRWENATNFQGGFQRRDDDRSPKRVSLLLDSLLFYIGSICQQGLTFSTRFISGRFIIVTSLLCCFAVYQFYSASIVATLLMAKPKTIRTLPDLTHSSLEVGIEDIIYNRDFFVRTNDPDAIKLHEKKMFGKNGNGASGIEGKKGRGRYSVNQTQRESSKWYTPECGLEKMRKGGFAFHVDVATAYKIISDTFSEKEICDLAEIQLFPPQKMVGIVQKGSPLRKMLTYGLRRVTEVGLMDYQRKVWHNPKPRCVKQIHIDDLKVDMETFASPFLLLMIGYAVSLMILCVEIIYKKLQSSKKSKKPKKIQSSKCDA